MADASRAVPLPSDSPEYRRQVERLIRRLGQTEGTLQDLAVGELDAVLDPVTASPILLSRAQQALARSEARYRDLVNRAPMIVCELSPTGETLFVNDAVRAVLGYEAEKLHGQNWWSRVVPLIAGPDAQKMCEAMEAGDLTGYELQVATADGKILWMAWNSANRYTPDGSLEAIVLFGLDVSARREAEENSRKLEQERVARAEAEAANRAKSEFLAVMSHELRTPLNAIAGYTDLLLLGIHGPISPDQEEALERIRRSQRHLLALIDDVLSFARLEAGRLELSLADNPVLEVMRSAQAVTQPLAEEKNLSYEVTECDPDLSIWADRDRTEQVLINLIANAIKYTPQGGAVHVDCLVHDDRVDIRVTDTGAGIPREKMDVIFEPFMQLKDAVRGRQGGVGLGLAISRDLARAMNGEITVESIEGVGSTFALSLPRSPAQATSSTDLDDVATD